MKISALGMRLDTGYITVPSKQIIVSLAGPVASFLIFLVSGIAAVRLGSVSPLYRFAFFNLCVALINIVPVVPLDGGCALKAFLTFKFGIMNGLEIAGKINVCMIAILSLACFVLLKCGCMSISFTMVVLFLIASTNKENEFFLLEKSLVLSGRTDPGSKIRYICVDSRTHLLNLISYIGNGFSIVAAVFEDERFIGELSQNEIIAYIGEYGAMYTVGECFSAGKEYSI